MKVINRVLILFAHPALHKSRVNRVLIEQVHLIEGVRFQDLYEAYPEFDIDVSHEQEMLESSDVIVFQYPFFWYSMPAMIKEWLDLVLQHDWAYGSKGTALHGKTVMLAITTGGRESAYREQGLNRYNMSQFLRPFEQTAHLCGMHFLPPFIVHGTHQMTTVAMAQHAVEYRQVLEALRDGRIDTENMIDFPRININLNHIISSSTGDQNE